MDTGNLNLSLICLSFVLLFIRFVWLSKKLPLMHMMTCIVYRPTAHGGLVSNLPGPGRYDILYVLSSVTHR